MSVLFRHVALCAFSIGLAVNALAQSGTESSRPPAVIPVASEPAPKLLIYPPLPDALARGVVIIQFRTENARVLPVFGQNAVDVSPRLGHLHVTVDDWPGTWAHTSQDPLILVGLKPGQHTILIEVADPSHKILTSETLTVTVPGQPGASTHKH